MAKELRHETLFGSSGGSGTSFDSASEFRNDSSQIIHIREISYAHRMISSDANEHAHIEISKSPVIASQTENNVFFTYPQILAQEPDASAGGAKQANGGRKYGRGQLTLEPNESLFVNIEKSTAVTTKHCYVIGYEF